MKQHFANLIEEEESNIDMTPMLDGVHYAYFSLLPPLL